MPVPRITALALGLKPTPDVAAALERGSWLAAAVTRPAPERGRAAARRLLRAATPCERRAMSDHRYALLPAPMRVIRTCNRLVVDLSDGSRSVRLDVPGGAVEPLDGACLDARAASCAPGGAPPGERVRVLAGEAGTRVRVLSEAAGAGLEIVAPRAARMLRDEDIVVVVAPSIAVLARVGGRLVESLAVALPTAELPDAAIFQESLWLLAGSTLLRLDLDRLPWSGEHRGVAVEYDRLGPLRVAPQPASVTVITGQKLLVDHPVYKRVTITRAESDPVVARGALVSLDQVVEPHTGLFQVRAWSLWSGPPSPTAAPEPLHLSAPDPGAMPVTPIGR